MTGTNEVGPADRLRIVALLPEPETAAATLACAVAAGRGRRVRLEAVRIGFDPERGVVSAEELDIQRLREVFEGRASDRGARVRQVFDAWAASIAGDVEIEWHEDRGSVETDVAAEAAGVDLIVVGRPSNLDARDALHAALFRTSKLVLVAPAPAPTSPATATGASGRSVELGRRIVVGWKPTDQARHAVEAAAGWLRAADDVVVVCVAKPGVAPYDTSARELFGRLGIAARFVTLQRDRRSVGELLLAEAHRLGGDCLLIGAFRHGPMWEAALGGVTRDVLARLDLPVFLRR